MGRPGTLECSLLHGWRKSHVYPQPRKTLWMKRNKSPRFPPDGDVGIQGKKCPQDFSFLLLSHRTPQVSCCFLSPSREDWVGERNGFKIMLGHELTQILQFNLWPYILAPNPFIFLFLYFCGWHYYECPHSTPSPFHHLPRLLPPSPCPLFPLVLPHCCLCLWVAINPFRFMHFFQRSQSDSQILVTIYKLKLKFALPKALKEDVCSDMERFPDWESGDLDFDSFVIN